MTIHSFYIVIRCFSGKEKLWQLHGTEGDINQFISSVSYILQLEEL